MLLRRLFGARAKAPVALTSFDGPTRFRVNPAEHDRDYVTAAERYVANAGAETRQWLLAKPYDPTEGHREFFRLTYNVLNLLEAMALPAGAAVLEVGSGPGWLTELLASLGYRVYALEPCPDMIRVAERRLAACGRHPRFQAPPAVEFLCQTLEGCDLPGGSVQGVIFHESLHHLIDEEKALANAFRILAPSGVLGVTGEGCWVPGDRAQEDACAEETARLGTLESPYTFEYLQYLLKRVGFADIVRYHGVNGFFPESDGAVPLARAAQDPAPRHNHLTARKPSGAVPTTADVGGRTSAKVSVLAARPGAGERTLRLRVRLVNTGQTVWLHEPREAGWVTLALFCDAGPAGRAEAVPRQTLPGPVAPGEAVVLDVTFALPEGENGPWYLDLVNENRFWFSHAGALAAPVACRLVPA